MTASRTPATPSATDVPESGSDDVGRASSLPQAETLSDSEATVIRLKQQLQQYWGYPGFRPLQREAMSLVMHDRDSLVVLPTGGGKSLCFQVPALCREGMAVVVSPLISLMKDQVDSLQSVGVSAACINSMQTNREKIDVAARIRGRDLKLLYIAPERLVQEKTLEFLQEAGVSFVAIDEAHCISQWGHDFRPEYRQLNRLKEVFPGVSVHGYTATATEAVRHDIVTQLGLCDAEILVGSFDRPNLQYRVERRFDSLAQIQRIVDRHKGESGIIYCISRKNVEATSDSLNRLGYQTLPYHAGMPDEKRRRSQDAFIDETADIIVATVAFGMGIDKSNVRFVIHAEMPRSLENYQQESGRAGRDGLEAECSLLYSAGDVETWDYLMRDTEDPAIRDAGRRAVSAMQQYCTSTHCRHQLLVRHFGQSLETDNCGACDICLNQMQPVTDSLIVGQKILSCVIRQGQRFGASYTAQVLRGSKAKRILENQHEQLSTWGLLKDESEPQVRNWIDQLVSHGFLRAVGEYNCLEVTDTGRLLLKGDLVPTLLRTKDELQGQTAGDLWAGVDRGLFEELRSMRTRLAVLKHVPPYIIFGDATLRELAKHRPTKMSSLKMIHGVGKQKLSEFGPEVLSTIRDWCHTHDLAMETQSERRSASSTATRTQQTRQPERSKSEAYFDLFEQRLSMDEVCLQLDRAVSTVAQYLEQYIRIHRVTDIDHWVPPDVTEQILAAIEQHGAERLKPLFDHLQGRMTYEQIRLVCAARAIRLNKVDDP